MSEVKGKGAEAPEQDERLEQDRVEPEPVRSRHPIVGKCDKKKLKASVEMMEELPGQIAEMQAALEEAGAYVGMHAPRTKNVPLAELVGRFQSTLKAEAEENAGIAKRVEKIVKQVTKAA